MMSRKYRTGIVGLGRIGFTLQYDRKREQPASHASAFSKNPSIRLEGGFDLDLAKRRAFANAYPDAKVYDSLKDMLRDGDWDILVCAASEPSHLPVMKSILDAKPLLAVCEKPVAPNLEQARKILKHSTKRGIPVAVNHERRFSKDYLLVKDAIASGRFGGLLDVSARLMSGLKAIRRDDDKLGRGCLIHDGTHILDIAGYVTGGKVRIESTTAFRAGKRGEADGIAAEGYVGNATFRLACGYRSEPFVFELDLAFERGRIRVGNGLLEFWESKPSPYYEGFKSLAPDRNVKPFRRTGYFSGMVQNCVDFLNGDAPLLSPLEDGVKSLAIIDEIVKSLND